MFIPVITLAHELRTAITILANVFMKSKSSSSVNIGMTAVTIIETTDNCL